jgi:preprotein translocase subunit SecG
MIEFLERLVIIFVSVFVASGILIANLLTEQKRVSLFLRM